MNQKTVVGKVDSLLIPLGYHRHGFTWNHRRESAVEVVDIQLSKAGDAVTVNAGVLDSIVYAAFWGSGPLERVEQPMCTVGARVGELIDGDDKWWKLDGESTPDDIAKVISAHVLPFIEQVATRYGMEKWLIDSDVARKRYPPPIINLAVLKSLRGEREVACALLGNLKKKTSGPWQTRVADVAGRIGCPR
jgi:hypothetical protein